jgi:hypothetical protein
MRLIDADELKIKLADELSDALGETDFTDGLHYGLKLAISLAEETPLADAKPIRHGHWIGIDDEPCESYECDKCGYITEDIGCNYGIPNNFNYCPNCGAKMDTKGEEE